MFSWSEHRPIESLSYRATANVTTDLSRACIGALTLVSRGHRLDVALPSATVCERVSLVGDPVDFAVHAAADGLVPRLEFVLPVRPSPDGEPALADGSQGSRRLPQLTELGGIQEISVSSSPLDVPFDVSSLLQFPGLEDLELAGACANWESLQGLSLRGLALRFVPDLSAFPSLSCWPDLERIIVFNCDADASKVMRSQMKKLPPTERHRSVSHPRTRTWFLEEYGLPFDAWPTKSAGKATAAFKAAVKTVKAATSTADTVGAISAFTAAANSWPEIETSEREDLARAVILLTKLSSAPIPETQAVAIFDAERTF
ncbi:hypothetical protein [Microbacterium sp. NPDC091662]|uniref:hypothetical protein n=1 Tax=Microbacterium sp. NPDC091662 TaxID=3364211 RepID=UPI003825397A